MGRRRQNFLLWILGGLILKKKKKLLMHVSIQDGHIIIEFPELLLSSSLTLLIKFDFYPVCCLCTGGASRGF